MLSDINNYTIKRQIFETGKSKGQGTTWENMRTFYCFLVCIFHVVTHFIWGYGKRRNKGWFSAFWLRCIVVLFSEKLGGRSLFGEKITNYVGVVALWPGCSAGWSTIPLCQGCGFHPWSRRIQVSTKECTNKWNDESMLFFFLSTSPPSLLHSPSLSLHLLPYEINKHNFSVSDNIWLWVVQEHVSENIQQEVGYMDLKLRGWCGLRTRIWGSSIYSQ